MRSLMRALLLAGCLAAALVPAPAAARTTSDARTAAENGAKRRRWDTVHA